MILPVLLLLCTAPGNLASHVIRGRLAAGERGRALRVAAGLSQQEVAYLAEVSVATISRWEAGDARPRRAAAERYSRVLDEIEATIAEASDVG